MFYFLRTGRHEQQVSKDDLPMICVEATGGGHNEKQTAKAMQFLTFLHQGTPCTLHFRDRKGDDWEIESRETIERPIIQEFHGRHPSPWDVPGAVAYSRGEAIDEGLRYYYGNPCDTHPDFNIHKVRDHRCCLCASASRALWRNKVKQTSKEQQS